MSSAPNDELSELLHSSHFTSKFTNGSIAPAILRRPTIDHALLLLVILVQIEESRGKYEEDVMGLNEYYYRLLYKPLVAAEPS
jgi:hypothetical protein